MQPSVEIAERLKSNMRDSMIYLSLLKNFGKAVAEHWLSLLEFEQHDSDPIMELLVPSGRWALGVSDASEAHLKEFLSEAHNLENKVEAGPGDKADFESFW